VVPAAGAVVSGRSGRSDAVPQHVSDSGSWRNVLPRAKPCRCCAECHCVGEPHIEVIHSSSKVPGREPQPTHPISANPNPNPNT
jgi:hypothetical protein